MTRRDGVVALGLDRFRVRLSGLPAPVERELRERWDGYLDAADAPDDVALLAVAGGPPLPAGEALGEFAPKSMRAERDGDGVRFALAEGELVVAADGAATLRLREDAGGRAYFTVANLLRAGVAWRLAATGGALLHAAAAIVDGRGFVLVGAEGAGKSTWAREARRGGARVVSDDLVVLDLAGAPAVIGAPFRSDYRGPRLRGRWPLAALLVPRRGAGAPSEPLPRILALAAAGANLPFLLDALEHDERVGGTIRRLTDAAPWRTFAYDADDPALAERLASLPR